MSGAPYGGRIIETDADVAEGAAWLARVEPKFAEVWQLTGPWPLRRREGGFPAVLFAITGQLISTAAASACWARLEAAGLTGAAAVAASDENALRACGLSRPKARYALALARADLDYEALERMEDAAVVTTLCAHPGIGRWTAEIYAALALGRADVLAIGDLALQEAVRMVFDLPTRPTAAQLQALARPWSPWRGVAARGLWAYYRHRKSREGIL